MAVIIYCIRLVYNSVSGLGYYSASSYLVFINSKIMTVFFLEQHEWSKNKRIIRIRLIYTFRRSSLPLVLFPELNSRYIGMLSYIICSINGYMSLRHKNEHIRRFFSPLTVSRMLLKKLLLMRRTKKPLLNHKNQQNVRVGLCHIRNTGWFMWMF